MPKKAVGPKNKPAAKPRFVAIQKPSEAVLNPAAPGGQKPSASGVAVPPEPVATRAEQPANEPACVLTPIVAPPEPIQNRANEPAGQNQEPVQARAEPPPAQPVRQPQAAQLQQDQHMPGKTVGRGTIKLTIPSSLVLKPEDHSWFERTFAAFQVTAAANTLPSTHPHCELTRLIFSYQAVQYLYRRGARHVLDVGGSVGRDCVFVKKFQGLHFTVLTPRLNQDDMARNQQGHQSDRVVAIQLLRSIFLALMWLMMLSAQYTVCTIWIRRK